MIIDYLSNSRISNDSSLTFFTICLEILISRRDCERAAEYLRSKQISAKPYHAGLRDEERSRAHELWLHGTFKVGSHYFSSLLVLDVTRLDSFIYPLLHTV